LIIIDTSNKANDLRFAVLLKPAEHWAR